MVFEVLLYNIYYNGMGCNCILIVLLVNLICMYILTSQTICVWEVTILQLPIRPSRSWKGGGTLIRSIVNQYSWSDANDTGSNQVEARESRVAVNRLAREPVWVSYLPARGHSWAQELLLTWVCDLVQPSSSGRAVLTASSGGSSAQLYTANDKKKKSSTGDGANEPNLILKSAWWERESTVAAQMEQFASHRWGCCFVVWFWLLFEAEPEVNSTFLRDANVRLRPPDSKMAAYSFEWSCSLSAYGENKVCDFRISGPIEHSQ